MASSATVCTSLSGKWFWKQRNPGIGLQEELNNLPRGPEEGLKLTDPADRESIVSSWNLTKGGDVPSEIHVELLGAGIIPHPYRGFGIADPEWLYACSFSLPAEPEQAARVKSAILTFEGLDTISDVYLNGEKVIQADNMFRGYQYHLPNASVGVPLKGDNTLLLHFASAKALAKQLEAEFGKVRAGSTNLGDPSRVYVRKAQYGWRWDWGPELMTCGPYRPITLTTIYHSVYVEDIWTKAWVSPIASPNGTITSYLPSLAVDVTVAQVSEFEDRYCVEIVLLDPDSHNEIRTLKSAKLGLPFSAANATRPDGHQKHAVVQLEWPDLRALNVQPWWPAGMGAQKLYLVEVRLLYHRADDEANTPMVVQSIKKRVGFRSARLVENPLVEPDQYGKGTTFFFEINGERVFVGGSNWIPADNFLTTLSEQRYREWLTLVRDGNQTMVRVWGGGIYEPDIFYDICDELGLLVWQDFQFACGVYPGVSSAAPDVAPKSYPAFVLNVKKEAEYNVKRLRHHPSIVVWCGNNEDYQMVLQWGDVPHLPATVLYEDILPSIVKALTSFTISFGLSCQDVEASYVRGSPYGGQGWDTADPTVGDVHQWNVWGGKELPYQEYGKLGGRFISEFGIPSFPALKTVQYWMEGADQSEWYAQSKAMAQHIRAGSYERRFAILMNENFRNVASSDFDRYRFNTQVMQSEAVSYAYRVWRREWRGKGKEYCGGVLVWQFNDCWPVASWALVDYFMRPKPVYHTIRRSLEPIAVNILREVVQNRANDRPKQFYEYGATRSLGANLHIWAVNTTRKAVKVKLDIQYFDLESDWTSRNGVTSEFTLPPNQSTDLLALVCPSPPTSRLRDTVGPGIDGSGTVVVLARLLDPSTNLVLARFVDWPQPFRYLHIPDPQVDLNVLDVDLTTGDATIQLSVAKPAKCLWLEAEDEQALDGRTDQEREVKWNDNALDIVPGDSQVVVARGLGKRKVKVTWLKD
ncbi:beta-mannosidase [Coprinopsis cinerea okayama7|uniref:beta-mannosidase n=1 Tax=Coprinopsis cinerea (strain Okayama-7 / 130 / ATCC MYA-4618 / FGSC 9003) TaxID=240176 RepID=A8PF07_COPC7|nr:beta-mannosidase [Coprinopsis cinerea okayama7\|eukprot:XP_001840892.1 beta-mannosidase [Coprinopsis cinerea okayama7\